MNNWTKPDEGLLDVLALALDDHGVAVVNVLCDLGITFETATLIVSSGNESMLATYEAIRNAHDRNATRTAALLVRKGLADG